jgi:hypothetical protein
LCLILHIQIYKSETMKHMTKTVFHNFIKIKLAIITLIYLSSCSKKYIQVFETASTNTKNIDSTWYFENDTIKISYQFWAEKGVLSFSIFNKLNKPIYVDWKKSAFIFNGNKINYWDNIEKTSFKSNGYSYYYTGPNIRPGQYNMVTNTTYGNVVTTKPEQTTFIPPMSQYTRSQFFIMPITYFKMKNLDYKRYNVSDPNNNKNKYVIYQMDYNSSNTPLSFRNYLSFSTDENISYSLTIDNQFYISKIMEMRYKYFMGKQKYTDKGNIEYQFPYCKNTSFYIKVASDYSMEVQTYYNPYNP